jgi:hypothetical protein
MSVGGDSSAFVAGIHSQAITRLNISSAFSFDIPALPLALP